MNYLILVLVLLISCNAYGQRNDDYRNYVLKENNFKKNYDSKKNLYLENNIVHIFIDENGNLIETGIPTTAIEKYAYKLHLITTAKIASETDFEYSFRGEYRPTLNIQNETITESEGETLLSENRTKIVAYSFATIGPFTDDFSITLKKKLKSEQTFSKVILDVTINVAKTFHVSISTGLFMSTLMNPINIRQSINSNNEITLIADDANTRGIVSLNAVFYPKGRTFLFPPSGGLFSAERFGVLVGTQINKDQFENFIGGIQFDFARGGSFSIGAHYGRRNTIVGYEDFEFGIDKFEGNLDELIAKNWNLGLVLGINLDVRIFGQLFNSN